MFLRDTGFHDMQPVGPPESGTSRVRVVVAQNTLLIFIAYLATGLEAAVVPGYVDRWLGLGATLAGVALGMQPLATLISRTSAGSVTHQFGSRLTVFRGLMLILLSGLCFIAGTAAGRTHRWLDYAVLLVSRLVLGLGISWVSAAGGAWAIGRAGQENSARIFVWSGLAAYSSLGLGAPLGLWISTHWSTPALGLLISAIALAGGLFALRLPDGPDIQAIPLRLFAVVRRVAPYGSVLFLTACGYGIFLSFVTLYFQSRQWAGAAWPLALCGAASVAIRLVVGGWIDQYSVVRIGVGSLIVELTGLGLLALATTPTEALIASFLIGAGFSLIFPILCVPTVASVGATDRASAISVYTGFLELATTLAGPVAGLIIGHAGFRPAFWLGFILAGAGCGLLARMLRKE